MGERETVVTIRMSEMERQKLHELEEIYRVSATDVVRRLIDEDHERRSVAHHVGEVRDAWRGVCAAHTVVREALEPGKRRPSPKELAALRGALDGLWDLLTGDMFTPGKAYWQGYNRRVAAVETHRSPKLAADELQTALDRFAEVVDLWVANIESGEL